MALKIKNIIILFVCLLLFTGCTSSKENQANISSEKNEVMEENSRDIFAMDTYMNLKAFGKNSNKALDLSENKIKDLEELFSVTEKSSEISKLNSNKQLTLSDDTYNIITAGLEYSKKTNGALNIAIYPVLKSWGFTTGDYKIPKSSDIEKLLKNCDESKIELSNNNNIKIVDDMEIDLGSVAKGYTGDKIKEIYLENGVESGVISLGGNVCAIGNKPDGSLWNVGICDPFDPATNCAKIKVSDKNVITSGNYERYFEKNGKRYCHIIDPKTGSPADNGIISATIIGEKGIMCDAFSTAFFVMGKDKAIDFWKNSSENFDFILIDDKGNFYISEGIEGTFENLKNTKVTTVEK